LPALGADVVVERRKAYFGSMLELITKYLDLSLHRIAHDMSSRKPARIVHELNRRMAHNCTRLIVSSTNHPWLWSFLRKGKRRLSVDRAQTLSRMDQPERHFLAGRR